MDDFLFLNRVKPGLESSLTGGLEVLNSLTGGLEVLNSVTEGLEVLNSVTEGLEVAEPRGWVTHASLPDLVNGSSLSTTHPVSGAAVEVERAVTVDLQDLQQEMRDRGNSRPKDEELLWTLKQQLVESQQEVELERRRNQELQSQIEELQGRTLVQQSSHGDTSLLSEKVHSLDTLSWGQDKEQVTQEVSSILDMLLPVSHGLEAPQHQDDTLQGLLGYLRIAAERIVHIHTVQNAQLIEENTELQLNTCSRLEEIVQRAIKDRDDAIAKKTAVEAELVRTRNDMMCLNNQLLDAVQHKLQLSQELEAWQDDIQVIINQQLRSQQQTQPKPERKHSSRLSFLHKTLSTSPTCTPNASPAHVHSPWREWFKLGK